MVKHPKIKLITAVAKHPAEDLVHIRGVARIWGPRRHGVRAKCAAKIFELINYS